MNFVFMVYFSFFAAKAENAVYPIRDHPFLVRMK